ncbi:hypothetical protein FACS1894127_7970 [Clostridia bacterium]|nr:hypothetical protein FACS1894127_7970 [Clostridia bacterium]
MGVLGLTAEGFTSHKMKRFLGFLIDALVVSCLLFIAYSFLGKPDYPKVKLLMDNLGVMQGTEGAQAAANEMFKAFDSAWFLTLLIWFGYEVISALIFRGATLGKLICRFQIVNNKDGKYNVKTALRIVLRSLVRMVFLGLLQGIPFLISSLTIFANKEHRAGIDFFAGTRVVERSPKPEPEQITSGQEVENQAAEA